MKVGITGASGFIGKHLIAALRAASHECVAFARRPSHPVPGCVETRSAKDALDVSGLDAVVNLAGESIMGRWTYAKRKRVIESRVGTTNRVVEAMRAIANNGGPRVLISASATGFYGDRGEDAVDETSPAGPGFLSDVTQQWEAAALPADSSGIRVARVRIGFVLGLDGGAFPPLRRIFSLGLGGRLGSGKQWMSPVHVDDVTALIAWLIEQPHAAGTFNAVCPNPVRNVDFTRELGRALQRPTVLVTPAWALRLVLGETSHLALDSQRVLPTRTLEAGYRFRHPDLASMLDNLIQK